MEQKVVTEAEWREIFWQFDRLVERICRLDKCRSDYLSRMLTVNSTLLDVCSNKYLHQQLLPVIRITS